MLVRENESVKKILLASPLGHMAVEEFNKAVIVSLLDKVEEFMDYHILNRRKRLLG